MTKVITIPIALKALLCISNIQIPLVCGNSLKINKNAHSKQRQVFLEYI